MSDETKQRVRRISRELNYQPRRRTLERLGMEGQSVRVAVVIVGNSNNVGIDNILTGLANVASRYRMKVELISVTESDIDVQVDVIHQQTSDCDGVILYGRSVSHELLAALSDAGVEPLIMFGSVFGDPLRQDMRTVVVACDFAAMGQLATRSLLEAGHRRIAFISAERPLGMWNERWLAGYICAHAEAGMLPEPDLFREVKVDDVRTVGVVAANRVLSHECSADAFVFTNDFAASRFVATLKDAGQSVPTDAMVIGGDYARALDYGLEEYALITQDQSAMIDAVLQLLSRGIDGRPLPAGGMMIPFMVHNLSGANRKTPPRYLLEVPQ